MRDRYRRIARVEKTHGRQGEVVTVPVRGLPSLVREGLTVAVVPPALKGSRWHRVVSCEGDGRSGSLVALSGVSDLTAAESLVGRYLLVRESDLPDDLALHDAARLVGRTVRDVATGEEGVIEEILSGPANDVWVVRGERGELLLPVIEQVVSDVPDEGAIEVRVPAGLDWEVR
ncbi:ribosome maturation factor RimM [Thermophilibacter sp.]|uniref:ribosome maturation factor RimM n=1 Tax=Thermophilibacter sp. TaxID=2847309 RepID=UPI003A8E68EF